MFGNRLACCFLLNLLVSCSIDLVHSSEEEEAIFVSPTAGADQLLKCDDDKGVWKRKNGTEYQDLVTFKSPDRFVAEGGDLTIKSIMEEDAGFYACFVKDEMVKEYDVSFSFRIKKILPSFSVDLGASTVNDISCHIVGNSDVQFVWFARPEGSEKADDNLVPICGTDNIYCQDLPNTAEAKAKAVEEKEPAKPFNERLTISNFTFPENHSAYSVLRIDDAQMEDRQIYVCRAFLTGHNTGMSSTCAENEFCEEVETLLRVKDPLAAVWPFIGIVAEVICLCVVIFFCERKEAARDKEEMDEDGYAANNVGSNSTVRQRK